MNSLENDRFLTPLRNLPKNVGDLGKSIVALKSCPKYNKSPDLVTLMGTDISFTKFIILLPCIATLLTIVKVENYVSSKEGKLTR